MKRALARIAPLAALTMSTALVGCGEDAQTKGEGVEPTIQGKTDFQSRLNKGENIAFGGDMANEFKEDFEFIAHEFYAAKGDKLTLEVTQRGTRRGLDTQLFVYGPKKASGEYGDRIASDDDAGYGALSKVSLEAADAGIYMVVVGTHDGAGRGNFNLNLRCDSGTCGQVELEPICPEPVKDVIADCVQEYIYDSDYEGNRNEGFEGCTGDWSSDVFYGACEARWAQSGEWCLAGEAAFTEVVIPACRAELAEQYAPPVPNLALRNHFIDDDLYDSVYGSNDDHIYYTIDAWTYDFEGTGPAPLMQVAQSVVATAVDDEHLDYTLDEDIRVEDETTIVSKLVDWSMYAGFGPDLTADAGSETFQVASYSYEYYVAAGAEEWVTIYVFSFDNRKVYAVTAVSGE
ncbi:MAG: hypothetical protein ACE366_17510 [Bradymonadia bacterium]